MNRMAVPKLRFKDSEGREFPEWEEKILGEYLTVSKSRNTKCAYSKEQVLSVSGELGVVNQISLLGRSYAGASVVPYRIVETGDIVYTKSPLKANPYGIETVLQGIVCLPSLPEQQKIADFLTAYDTMIDTQTKRVEAIKTRKKGLLQKIFSQEIRFKDEQGQVYPEWIVQKLEELVSMHARIGWQNLRTSEFLNSGDYYLVTGTDFVNGKIDFSTCHYIGKERFEQDKKIQLDNDNILITKDGTLGKVAYVDILPKPTTLNAGIFCLKSKKQNINMKYLFQYLRGPFMMQYCNRHSTGGTIKHLNQGVLITFPVPLPSLSEQQKIADFLTAVDHQIEVEEKRLETMKTIKKGLLQQMFI